MADQADATEPADPLPWVDRYGDVLYRDALFRVKDAVF
jgi:hypothetical protein